MATTTDEVLIGIHWHKLTAEVKSDMRNGWKAGFVFELSYGMKIGTVRQRLNAKTEADAKREAAHILLSAASFGDAADALAEKLRVEHV